MTRPATTASTPADLGSSTTPHGTGSQRLVRALLPAAAALGLVALAGCSTMSPSQTQVPYQPADGVALDVGSVQARDLLLVASAKGATGVLSGSLINTGTASVTVSFGAAPAAGAAGAGTTTPALRLAPREQKRITGAEIPTVPVAPGSLTQIVMTTTDGDGVASVPVLLPAGYYATLTPGPSTTSTATTTEAATATPTAATTTTAAAG